MNGEYLYEAMGGIAPVYVDEAEKVRFSAPLWRKLVPAAACLAVLLGMYAGFQALLYGTPVQGGEFQIPSAAGSPAAQAVTEHFRDTSWCSWGSLLLGLAAWVLPIVGLIRKQHRQSLTLGSFICCILALLLQVCNVLLRVNNGDFTTLNDTMWFVILASVVLLVGTAVMNGIVQLILHRPNSNRITTTILVLFFAWLLVWFLLPNHLLILGSSDVYHLDNPQAVSDEYAADLITIINRSGGKRKAFSDYDQYPILEYTPSATITQHNRHYSLVYVYDNGFSFNPFHFGEDSAHYVLIKYNLAGEAVSLWKLSYNFDQNYREWTRNIP